MKRTNTILLVAAVVLTLSSFANPSFFKNTFNTAKEYVLKYNPEEGTSGTMVMDYTMEIGMDFMGQTLDMDQKMEMGAKMKVTKNTDSEITTEMAYDYFAMSMSNPMVGEMAYDSRKENNEGLLADQLEASFDELFGKTIILVQDHSGKTLRTEGMDDMLGMNQSQGSLDFASVMGMSQFPEGPIKIGDSWEHVMDDASSPMKIASTMTLSKVENGKVYISFESEVSGNDNFDMEKAMEDTDAEGEETPDLDVSGTQSGSFVYEESTMWLIEGLIKQDLTMTVSQMGMEIPMTINGNMVMVME